MQETIQLKRLGWKITRKLIFLNLKKTEVEKILAIYANLKCTCRKIWCLCWCPLFIGFSHDFIFSLIRISLGRLILMIHWTVSRDSSSSHHCGNLGDMYIYMYIIYRKQEIQIYQCSYVDKNTHTHTHIWWGERYWQNIPIRLFLNVLENKQQVPATVTTMLFLF
jgi:hypothetical protein